jgi:hypothetical protein
VDDERHQLRKQQRRKYSAATAATIRQLTEKKQALSAALMKTVKKIFDLCEASLIVR